MENTEIENDYFLDTDDEMLALLESKADLAITEISNALDNIRSRAVMLFNLLLAGVGGLLLLMLGNEMVLKVNALMGVFIFTCLGWGSCAILLAIGVIATKQRIIKGQRPEYAYNLFYKEDFNQYLGVFTQTCPIAPTKTAIFRRYDLHAKNSNIKLMLERNQKQSKCFNLALYGAIATPVITIVSFGCWWVV